MNRRVLVGTVALLSLVVGALPASAASVGSSPASSWGVFKACSSGGGNCGAVYAMTHVGSTIYLGGDFTHLLNPATGQKIAMTNLAAISASSGAPVSFRPQSFNGPVYALAATTSRLLVGGAFQTTADPHIAAYDLSGAPVSYSAGFPGTVRALDASSGTTLYAGGSGGLRAFDLATGAARTGFSARFSVGTGGVDVRTVALSAGRLYVGGHFDTVNGYARRSVAAVDPSSGSTVTAFNATVDAAAGDRLQAGDDLTVTSTGVLLAQAGHLNRAYRFDLSGRRLWKFAPDGDVQTVALIGSSVYLGGHFTCAANCYDGNRSDDVARMHIAAVDYATGQIDAGWHPGLGPAFSPYFYGVWATDVVSGALVAGGVFKTVTSGTSYSRPKVAIFR